MTTQEINEGNKLIAEFVGAKIHDTWKSYLDATYYIPAIINKKSPKTDEYTIEERIAIAIAHEKNKWNPQYHTSWDWLHPVIVKANEIYLNHRCDKWLAEFILTAKHDCFWELKVTTLIEVVWLAVVEFIKWKKV